MKLLKKKTTSKTINEAYKVGDLVSWSTSSFDGRVSEWTVHTGTVIKVNRKTVDVEKENGDQYRLSAYIKAFTGEWALA